MKGSEGGCLAWFMGFDCQFALSSRLFFRDYRRRAQAVGVFFAWGAEPIVKRTGGRSLKGSEGGCLAWFMGFDCQFALSSRLLFRDYRRSR